MFNNSEKFALIKADYNTLLLAIKELFSTYKINYLVEEVDENNLEKEISIIKNKQSKNDKFLFWEPPSTENYMVFYNNYSDGWYTLYYNLAKKYNLEIFIIFLDPIESKGKMGFYHYHNSKERIVRSLYDNKWTFFEKGEILSFESIQNYQKKMITQRMNNDIIKSYLCLLGINIDDRKFYNSKSGIFFRGKRIVLN